MAGKPFLQALNARIEKLGGDDWLFERIAEGTPIKTIAVLVECSRPFLYNWKKQKSPHREDRMRRWGEARKASADARLERGEEILEDLAKKNGVLLSPEVTLATSRAKYQMDMAKIANPEYNGAAPGLTLNVGTLHLDALRALGGPASLPPAEVKVLGITTGTPEEDGG